MATLSCEDSEKVTYEEARLKRIEDNKKRMEELGLTDQASLFAKSPSKNTTPRKYLKRTPLNPEDAVVERRSPRLTRNPFVNYNDNKALGLQEGFRRSKGIRRVLRRAFVSAASKTEAALKASEIKTDHPSFVKAMLKSHTSGGFWLGLPSDFCTTHFRNDDLVILEDEDGLEWETVYLHQKKGLSGGWRGFALDHGLDDGDAVVFELVNPKRFKVYITRAVENKKDDGASKVASRKRLYRYALKENKENEHVHSALHNILKSKQLQTEEPGKPSSSKRAKTVTTNRKRKPDLSSASEDFDGVEKTKNNEAAPIEISDSDDDCPADAGLTESPAKCGRRVLRTRVPVTRKAAKSVVSTSEEVKVPKVDTLRSNKNKPQKSNTGSQKRKVSEGNPTAVVNKNKAVVLTRKVRIVKKDVEQRTCTPVARKPSIKLPPGAKIKAWGVCSIVRNGSSSRKLPGGTRKYSFFSPGKQATAKAH